MSKAALNAFTRILADTCRLDGVLVNAVDPGRVRTDMGGLDGRAASLDILESSQAFRVGASRDRVTPSGEGAAAMHKR